MLSFPWPINTIDLISWKAYEFVFPLMIKILCLLRTCSWQFLSYTVVFLFLHKLCSLCTVFARRIENSMDLIITITEKNNSGLTSVWTASSKHVIAKLIDNFSRDFNRNDWLIKLLWHSSYILQYLLVVIDSLQSYRFQ